MVFSCTKKVLDELRKYKPIEDQKVDVDLWNWYVDLITLERNHYFLFTNSKTLFSFFIYAETKVELQNIEEKFKKKLEEMIVREIGALPKYTDGALGPSDSY